VPSGEILLDDPVYLCLQHFKTLLQIIFSHATVSIKLHFARLIQLLLKSYCHHYFVIFLGEISQALIDSKMGEQALTASCQLSGHLRLDSDDSW
jgi:hypothetical protein